MSVKRKTARLQNLNQIATFVQEDGAVSQYFNVSDFPEELPVGRSSFLIGGSNYLKENVSLKIELLDNLSNPIYIEPVFMYSEGGGVRVSVEVYNNISQGAATLTILGELDPDKVDFLIPDQFLGVYNVSYQRSLIVNKDIPNTRQIRFYKRPKISVKEVFREQLEITAETSGSITATDGTVTGVPSPNTEGQVFGIDSTEYGDVETYTDQAYGSGPIGSIVASLTDAYTFIISDAEFSSSMQGGTLTISSPVGNPGFATQSYHTTPAYSASISEVINKNTIAVQKPFGLFNSSSFQYEISAMDNSSYSITYPEFRSFTTSSINFRSFAELTIYNMRTFSGDVYRISAYTKDNGPYGNWVKIADTPIESPELLVDTTSTTGTDRVGFFRADSVVTDYWTSTAGEFGIESATTLQTASDPEYMPNSLFVSGANAAMLDDNNHEWIKLQLQPEYSMSFIEGTEYTVRAKLLADNSLGAQGTVKAVFHLSGSAFNMSTALADKNYGRPIGKKEFGPDAQGRFLGTDNPNFEAVFVPDRSGTAVLQVRFTGGHWHISDISVRPNTDTNFSPELIKMVAPIPPLSARPDELDFAVEFYDVNNNKSGTVVTTLIDSPTGITFQGENLSITGDDNTIAGSLFIGGDATGSGIQMGGVTSTLPETGTPGASGSGFIRSVQYQGFSSASLDASNTGWMIYSGSVLPDSGDDYDGVGLELVGESGSFRFGTNPSRFEVVADAFFVGSTGAQFISGSEGIIEISSSAFHLTPAGDVIISGSVTATEGYIGDWQIVDGKMSGSNATLDAVGAALYKSDSGPDSNPTDGYYVDFTPGGYYIRFGTDFAVSSSGELIASGAKIEGVLTSSQGLIADWSIAPGVLSSFSDSKYTGMSSAGDARFFAGAASLNATGSAPFNVKATGELTASDYRFDGTGTITGSVTIGSSATILGDLSANAIHVPSAGPYLAEINSTGFARFISASIGSFDVDSNALRGAGFFMSGAATGNQFFISSSNFNVKASGNITASAANITGDITANTITANTAGTIANFAIDSTEIKSANEYLRLKSSGQITASSALISGSSVDLRVPSFILDTDNFDVDSTAGTIQLGSNPTLTSGNGIFLSSSGEFKLGDDDGNINFTDSSFSITGSDLSVNVTTLNINAEPGFELSSTQESMSLGSSNQINLDSDGGTGGVPIFKIDGGEISASNFFVSTAGDLTASAAKITGDIIANTITANTAGTIANFAVNSAEIKSSNNKLRLKSSGQITASSANITGDITADTITANTAGTIANFTINSTEIASANDNLRLKASGQITASAALINGSSVIAGFTVGNSQINDAGSNLILKASGQITASAAKIIGDITADTITANTAGTIANFNINAAEIASANDNLRLKASGQITSSAALINGTSKIAGFIVGNTQINDVSIGQDNLVLKSSGEITGSQVQFTGGDVAGFTIATTGITSTGIGVHPSGQTYAFTAGSSNEFNVKHSGDITGSKVQFTGGDIAGFTITDTFISSSGLLISSDGRIESVPFVSSLLGAGVGWRIDADGKVEFENATIRGTLSTAVFEKDTISAVGGQVIVANATTVSGSDYEYAATQSINVENIGGFIPGEFLIAKATGSNGFTREFMFIDSTGSNSMTVHRGLDGNQIQTLSDGQVMVSQGSLNSGYVHINADPNDATTPYIDIAERTGSSYGDIEIKARLGDLSGIGQSLLHGTAPENAGFGLYAGNVFLEGAIVANSGSIGGIQMQSEKLFTGAGTHDNSNTGFYLDSSSNFSLGDKLSWDGSNLSIEGSITITGGSGFATQSDVDTAATNAVTSGSNAASSAEANALTALNASGSALQGNIDTTGAGATASASAAQTAAEAAATAALNASGSALQGNIDTTGAGAALSASNAQSTANTAVTNASASQAAIDTMETQVVLSSGGMSLQNSSGVNIATYGTTTYFYDGVGHGSDNIRMQLQASGIKIIGDNQTTYTQIGSGGMMIIDNSVTSSLFTSTAVTLYGGSTNDRVVVDSTGMEVYESNAKVADFGSTTTIGNTATEHVEITGTALKLKDGGTTRITMDSSGITMGTHISIDSSGNASFSGALTIGAIGQVADVAAASSSIAQAAAEATAVTLANNAEASASGYAADAAQSGSDSADAAQTAALAAAVTLANNAASSGSDSASAAQAAAEATAVTLANNAADSGSNAATAAQAAAEATAVTLADNAASSGSDSADAAQAAAEATAQLALNASGSALQGNITSAQSDADAAGVLAGTATGSAAAAQADADAAGVLAGTATGSAAAAQADADTAGVLAGVATGSAAAAQADADTAGVLAGVATGSAAAAQLTANTATGSAATAQAAADAAGVLAGVATASAATGIGDASTAQGEIDAMQVQVYLDATGMELRRDDSKKVAKFGVNTYFYDGSDDENIKLHLRAAGITLNGDNDTTYTEIGSGGMMTIDNSVTSSVMTSGGVTLYGGDGGTYSDLTKDGLSVVSGGLEISQFSDTMTVGQVGPNKSNVHIDDSGNLYLRNNTTPVISLLSTGTGEFSGNITASGGSFTGDVTAGTVTIGSGGVTGTNFTLDAGGLTASNADISGDISATSIAADSGSIGGWLVGANELSSSGGHVLLSAQHKISVGGGNASHLIGSDGFQVEYGGQAGGLDLFFGRASGSYVHFMETGGAGGELQISSSHFNVLSGSVSMSGYITAAGGEFTGDVSAGSTTINAGGITGSQFRMGEDGLVMSAGTIALGSNFAVDAVGNMTASNARFSGNITASGGSFTGNVTAGDNVTIGSGGITGSNYTINGNGITITAGSITLGDAVLDSDGLSISGATSNISLGSGAFSVTGAGAVTASNINLTGDITATGGSFTGNVTAGTVTIGNTGVTGTNFTLDSSGLAATAANISGDIDATNITADSGSIGGFVVAASQLSSDGLFENPGEDTITGSIKLDTSELPYTQVAMLSGSHGAGVLTIAKGTSTDFGAEIRLGHITDGVVRRQIWMAGHSGSAGAYAAIRSDGMSYDDSSDTGFILEHSDEFGDRFQIGSTSAAHIKFSSNDNLLYMSSSNFFLGNKGTSFVSGSGTNVEISSSNFHLKPGGDVIMSGHITADAGVIGGFALTEDDFFAGSVAIGNDSTNIVIGDTDEDGKIAIGHGGLQGASNLSTADDMSMTNGYGVFLDGNGNAMIGQAQGASIKFIPGTSVGQEVLIISSSTFFLGSAANFISSSLGSLEISSSNFHVAPGGNVTMTGTITATAGEIGGFTLENSNLKTGTMVLSGSGGGSIKTAETGRRVELKGSDNSLTFYSGSTGTQVMELSDDIYAYVIAPGAGSYRNSGIKLTNGAGIMIDPQGVSGKVFVGINIPYWTDGTESPEAWIGYHVSHAGPAAIWLKRTGQAACFSGKLTNSGTDGETIGFNTMLHTASGVRYGAKIDLRDAGSYYHSDVSASRSYGIDINISGSGHNENYGIRTKMSGNAGLTNSSGNLYGHYIGLSQTKAKTIYGQRIDIASTAGFDSSTGTSYGLYIDNDYSETPGQYGFYVDASVSYNSGNFSVGATSKIGFDGPYYYGGGGGHTYIHQKATDQLEFMVGGTTMAVFDETNDRNLFWKDIYVTGADPTGGATGTKCMRIHNNNTSTYMDYNGGSLFFRDDGTTMAEFNTSRQAVFTNVSKHKAGILFGTDTAAANCLHDYEEGAWTPTLSNNGTATLANCRYIKIGSFVQCWGQLKIIQEYYDQTGDFILSGLPYAVTYSNVGGSVMMHTVNFVDTPRNLTSYATTAEQVYFYETKDNVGWDPVNWADMVDGAYIYFNVNYYTTS